MLMVNIFYTAMTSLYGMNMYFAKYVMQDAGYNKTMMMCSTFASILVPLLLIPIVQRIGKRNVALCTAVPEWVLPDSSVLILFAGEIHGHHVPGPDLYGVWVWRVSLQPSLV